jgi:hypothetical protein
MTKNQPANPKSTEAGKGGSIYPRKLKSGELRYLVKYLGVHIGTAKTMGEAEAMVAREAANDPWRGK